MRTTHSFEHFCQNHEVLRAATIPNVRKNGGIDRARFFAGDWTKLQTFLTQTYDIILAAETLYYPEHNNMLLEFVKARLAPTGVAYLSLVSCDYFIVLFHLTNLNS